MATPETITKELDPKLAEQDALKDIGADYEERFGFHDPEGDYLQGAQGPLREVVEAISEYKDEPEWMREFRLKALEHFRGRPTPTWGAATSARSTGTTSTTSSARPRSRAAAGTRSPRTSRRPSTASASPRRSATSWPGSAPSTSPRSSPPDPRGPREAGRRVPRHGLGPARVRGHRARALGHRHPPNDNKLAALNSAVWSGGSFVYVPKGAKVEMPLRPTSGSTPRTWGSSSAR